LQNFSKTDAAEDAASLITEVYTTWATEQRESSDFVGAETTLKTFKTWAGNAKRPENVKAAQRELAQTYLAWGLAFQGQKQFEDARAKFELAISTDPEPLAASGPAAQAKTAQIKLYNEWADAMLEKDDFKSAIDRYQTVLTLSESKDQPAVKDKIAGVHLKWAGNMSSSEDFLGALKKVDEAVQNTGTDAGKQAAENTKGDIYTAFSKSSGAQARQAMKDALKAACEKNDVKPSLPIFGLDKERIKAGIYGVTDQLPENVAAKTPGELHYVACIEMTTKTLAKETIGPWVTFVREKYGWNVTLKAISTGNATAKTVLEGGEPPPLPKVTWGNVFDYLLGGSFYRSRGTLPDVVELANWMLKQMK
jgi:tetratricopeptide (TPR) repeat protein